MKKSLKKVKVLLPMLFVLCFAACSNDDETAAPVAQTSTACNGGDGFCMNYGGVEKSGAAKLTVQSRNNKVRVFWEKGSGNAFEQLELDLYSVSDTGNFNVNDLAGNKSAFMQYYSISGGSVNVAYGTVTVTKMDTTTGVSGTFDVTMKDSTKITNGVFRNVVK